MKNQRDATVRVGCRWQQSKSIDGLMMMTTDADAVRHGK